MKLYIPFEEKMACDDCIVNLTTFRAQGLPDPDYEDLVDQCHRLRDGNNSDYTSYEDILTDALCFMEE